MRRIHKYKLSREYMTSPVVMPSEAEIVAVGVQGSGPMIWAIVETKSDPVERTYVVRITGEELLEDSKYVGTFQDGWFVGHIFELRTGAMS